MSKTGDTKRRILELLEHKHETLTTISNSLGLAPSTVSQHLQELVDSGSIRLVEDRPRKWKYYEINRYPNVQTAQRWYYDKRISIPIAIIAIIAVVSLVFYSAGKGNSIFTTTLTNQQGSLGLQQVYLSPGSTVPSEARFSAYRIRLLYTT